MTRIRFDDRTQVEAVDSAMKAEWAQGDVIRAAQFVHLGDPGNPGTPTAQAAADAGMPLEPQGLLTRVQGLVVVSQTCDIVAKAMSEAPFVQCAVLVELPEQVAKAARRGDRPRFVHVPQLGDPWFADLDQIVTIEKAMLCGTPHEQGVGDAAEQQAFGNAVGRKFSRYAFPDDLHMTLSDLQARFKRRHESQASPEGALLRQVLQIRVEADWSAVAIDARLIFILPNGALYRPARDDEPWPPSPALVTWFAQSERKAPDIAAHMQKVALPEDVACLWGWLVEAWVKSCKPFGKVVSLTADVVCADEITLSEYWNTQPLDLDYLTGRSPPT